MGRDAGPVPGLHHRERRDGPVNRFNGGSSTVGTAETLILDLSGGGFLPGAPAEADISEIELSVNLGDATDRVVAARRSRPTTLVAAGERRGTRSRPTPTSTSSSSSRYVVSYTGTEGTTR